MKARFLIGVSVFSAVLLVSATIWEGVTDVSAPRDLPRAYSVATNSFPNNTVVDITNLENGKMVRVVVVAGLETTGLLATLSRNAAEAIDLRPDSTCRIRMTQSSITSASRQTDGSQSTFYKLGPLTASGDIAPVVEEAATASRPAAVNTVAVNQAAPAESVTIASKPIDNAAPANNAVVESKPVATESTTAPAEKIADNTATAKQPAVIDADEPDAPDKAVASEEPPVTTNVVAAAEQQPEPRIASGILTLIPAEERIPAASQEPAVMPTDMVSKEAAPRNAVPADAVSLVAPPPVAQINTPAEEFSPFQAPLINNLEQGKWYVQLGVYTRPDNVEDEISRIGTGYPVAIQNIGTDNSPVFRVLLGPLNQGESGATLQRFKSIGYADAFVRHN